MDLVKVYLIQSITTAANNLRLNPQQIEVVGLLRETIVSSNDLTADLLHMKKTTELSKLAIRLGEIHSFLTQGKVDFVKISEQFREHSRYLIRDLNQFLENVNPKIYKEAFNKILGNSASIDVELVDRSGLAGDIMDKDVSEKVTTEILDEINNKTQKISSIDFEKKILSPIKPLDDLLKKLQSGTVNDSELLQYYDLMQDHAGLAINHDDELLVKMHEIIASALKAFIDKELTADKDVLDALRACLIVIAAAIKKKDVDITGYINRAEEFGKKYFNKNFQV